MRLSLISLKAFLVSLLLLITGCFALHAQVGSFVWFDQMTVKIETQDTVGLELQLLTPLPSSTETADQLRHQLAYCYLILHTQPHPLDPKAIDECKRLDSLAQDDSLHAFVNFIQGYYYYQAANYPIAIDFLNEAALSLNNTAHTMLEARCFMLRANILHTFAYSDEAQNSLMIAAAYYKANSYPKKEAGAYNNLALAYIEINDSTNAFRYMERSLALLDSTQDFYGLGRGFNNMGTLHSRMGHHEQALDYFKRGLEFRLKGGAPAIGIIESRINIGTALFALGRIEEAQDTLEKCLRDAEARTYDELMRRAANQLRAIYFEKGNYQEAYKMQDLYYALQDTFFNRFRKDELVRRTVEYDFRSREKEEEIRQTEKERRTNIIMISLGIGLLLAGFFVYNLYKSNQVRKRSNAIILRQRDDLNHKQKEITESIQYARYIQQTLLPEASTLDAALQEHFILYLPKDIVSGDFYWMLNLESGCLIAAADCTGHGVPGAFMSLLAKENLDKAAAITSHPGELLATLNRSIKYSLRQDSKEHSGVAIQDGLDIALVNIEGKRVTYAGANRPLWIYRTATDSIDEFKATKVAIGGSTSEEQKYAEQTFELESGDMIYLFTDGFADQFGGEKTRPDGSPFGRVKKLTTRKFREQLSTIGGQPAAQQKDCLANLLREWKREEDQIDDILVIGIRIR